MATVRSPDLEVLYHQDETAWLEQMARLIREDRHDELDYHNLLDYLEAMAKRDRREVESRLAVMLTHLLKWNHQPEKRGRSWLGTIEAQRHELELLLQSGTLRNHAEAKLPDAYAAALKRAALETGIDISEFPDMCSYHVQQLLELELSLEQE